MQPSPLTLSTSTGLSGVLIELPGCASSATQAKREAIGTAGESNGTAEVGLYVGCAIHATGV